MNRSHERRFTRHPASVGRARVFVAERLRGWCSPEQADDIRLCLSELATNAIEHGTPMGREFLVRVITGGEMLRLEVHDAGDGIPYVRTAADTELHGRGLFLVAALADDWGVSERIGPGKVVWAEFKIRQALEAAC